jgi:hypothetical protein
VKPLQAIKQRRLEELALEEARMFRQSRVKTSLEAETFAAEFGIRPIGDETIAGLIRKAHSSGKAPAEW